MCCPQNVPSQDNALATFILGLVTFLPSRRLHNRAFECPIRTHLDLYLAPSPKPVCAAAFPPYCPISLSSEFSLPTIHPTNQPRPRLEITISAFKKYSPYLSRPLLEVFGGFGQAVGKIRQMSVSNWPSMFLYCRRVTAAVDRVRESPSPHSSVQVTYTYDI